MGLFITLEGPEGSGKSTQAKALGEYLEGRGYSVLVTREPGGTSIGDQIRRLLHSTENTRMHPRTETLLYCASRAQLVEEVIKPHLDHGGVVICDRFADSTLAYQGFGYGLELGLVKSIIALVTGSLVPDMTFYLDLPVEDGLGRKFEASRAGETEWNRMDQLELAFHQRVRAGYLEMARKGGRWVILDATLPIEEIQRAIRERVKERLLAKK
jgi:dTMP kinase